MSFTNFQKTIALTAGVLVLSGAMVLVVIAWTGPTEPPPLDNAPAPINTGSEAQTKTGDLIVRNFALGASVLEGSISNVDQIIGYNDLRLRGDATGATKIDMGDGDEDVKIYTGGRADPTITVGADGNLYVPGLADCFLEVDETGKVKCYTGGSIPGGNLLETTQYQVASASGSCTAPSDYSCGNSFCSEEYTIQTGDVERVIRLYAYVRNTSSYYVSGSVKFYVNGVVKWSTASTYNNSKYYHISAVDEPQTLQVCISYSAWYGRSAGATGRIYILNAKRENITHAFSDGQILYWYEQGEFGEMSTPPEAGHYVGATPPVSVIVSAKDEEDVKWILE